MAHLSKMTAKNKKYGFSRNGNDFKALTQLTGHHYKLASESATILFNDPRPPTSINAHLLRVTKKYNKWIQIYDFNEKKEKSKLSEAMKIRYQIENVDFFFFYLDK